MPKRKVSESDSEELEIKVAKPKKEKVVKEKVVKEKKEKVVKEKKLDNVAAPDDGPKNVTFPTELSFNPPAADQVRIAAFNVCGIRASQNKGLKAYVAAENADILCLTETKIDADPNFDFLDIYPFRFFGADPKKGNAGIAIVSKIEPISVVYGIPSSDDYQKETNGRIITAEFENHFVLVAYTPNAGAKLIALDRREIWDKALENHLRELDAKKPIIWCGDQNVAQTPRDITNWKTNYNKSAGCSKQEHDGIKSQLEPSPESGHSPLIDVWRARNPEKVEYTYFSYRFNCRTKGIGWRLDMFICSERILEKVKEIEIRNTCYGASDHVPIFIDLAGPL